MSKRRANNNKDISKTIKATDFRDGVWHIKSLSRPGVVYHVIYESNPCSCTCTNFRLHQPEWCKHLWGVHKFVHTHPHMAPIGPIPVPVGRFRDWSEYHTGRALQIEHIQTLLAGLCRPLTTPRPSPRGGRPCNRVADVLYALVLRSYCNFPSRRFSHLLRLLLAEAQASGVITKVPGASSIQAYLGVPWMRSLLTELIASTSAPLRSAETVMAVDSSGFGGPTKQPFRRRKSGGKGKERGWKRAHIMCGVRTGIITAAIVTDAHAHDSQQLPDLLDMACQVFKVKEVLGDAAYSSAVNFEAVLSKKAMPYFMFKKTATGATAGVWRDMYLHFKNHRLDWEEHYRKRKIVESVFSAVKRMFGERLRSKGDVAARNELLLKLLCYNLCCLLRCMDELGIDVEFAREAPNGWLAEP